MRRAIPRLRDREEVGVAVIVEGDHPAQCICSIGDVPQRVVVDGDFVAVAIFYLRTTVFSVEWRISKLGAVG